jgi:hypothetical protein
MQQTECWFKPVVVLGDSLKESKKKKVRQGEQNGKEREGDVFFTLSTSNA